MTDTRETIREQLTAFREESIDNIQSALFEDAGWSSEDYSKQFGQYRGSAERVAETVFDDPQWSLIGFAVDELGKVTGATSDGHHTFDELYSYRMLYNAHAAAGWLAAGIPVVKSWHHDDGELCFGGGWFIVTATLPTGQVSNHYKAEHWDLFAVPAVDLPPVYDGHKPADAADRLRAALAVFEQATTPTDDERAKVRHTFDTDDCVTGECDCALSAPAEPTVTDEMVLAALNARGLSVRESAGTAKHFTPAPDLSYYDGPTIRDMYAALRAALAMKEGEQHG